MSHRFAAIAILATLVPAACGGPGSTDGDGTPSVPAPDPATAAQAGPEHTGFGTVNSVDLVAGTVNISHAAVASAGWPAMTMNFRLASPDSAASLRPGQRIEFRFTTEGGGTVTAVEPLP